jgi:hypothetical protein
MQKEGEEQAYELQKGSSLVHSKYKVLGKIGSTTHSTVHSISMVKGKKQIIRAVKVVLPLTISKLHQSKNRKSAIKLQSSNSSKILTPMKSVLQRSMSTAMKVTIIIWSCLSSGQVYSSCKNFAAELSPSNLPSLSHCRFWTGFRSCTTPAISTEISNLTTSW